MSAAIPAIVIAARQRNEEILAERLRSGYKLGSFSREVSTIGRIEKKLESRVKKPETFLERVRQRHIAARLRDLKLAKAKLTSLPPTVTGRNHLSVLTRLGDVRLLVSRGATFGAKVKRGTRLSEQILDLDDNIRSIQLDLDPDPLAQMFS